MNLFDHGLHLGAGERNYVYTDSPDGEIDFFRDFRVPGRYVLEFKCDYEEPGLAYVFNPSNSSYFNMPLRNFPIMLSTGLFYRVEIISRLERIWGGNEGMSAITGDRYRNVLEMRIKRDFFGASEDKTYTGQNLESWYSPSELEITWRAVEVTYNRTRSISANNAGRFFYDWVCLTPNASYPSSKQPVQHAVATYEAFTSMGLNWRIPFSTTPVNIWFTDDIIRTSYSDLNSQNFTSRGVALFDLDNSGQAAGLTSTVTFSFRRATRSTPSSAGNVTMSGQTTFPISSSQRAQFLLDFSVLNPSVSTRSY